MKVLHVITSLQKSAGTSVFCVELGDALKAMGHDVAVATADLHEKDAYPSRRDVPQIAIADVLGRYGHGGSPCVSISSGSPAPSGCWCLDDNASHIDLIHIHGLWQPALHGIAKRASRRGVPIIWSPHGMLTPWALKHKWLKKWFALMLYQYRDLQSSALLHATAASEVDDVRRMGLKQPVVVAPLGVNVPAEAQPPHRNNPKIALFVSRVHPKKGLFNLVDAWACLKKIVNERPFAVNVRSENLPVTVCDSPLTVNGVPWRCLIAGPDENGHAAEVMARARAAGVGADFEWIGPVFGKGKEALYAKADLFILPTFSENFGLVVIEALAHGCPVITTKGAPWAELLGGPKSVSCNPLTVNSKSLTVSGGECAETARKQPLTDNNLQLTNFTSSGRCGWWIDIGVDPLVRALEEALGLSVYERARMGENGRRLVERRYTWESVGRQMSEAYGVAIARRS